MKTLEGLMGFAAARPLLYRAALVSLAVGLIVPGAYAHTADDPFVTDLIAGGGNPASAIDVGDVLVWNDGEQLLVRYHVTAQDWCLTETHSHVATSADAIPQTKKGNPIPGKFDFSATLDCVTSFTLVVPMTWEPGVQLFIATHASLQNPTVVYSNGPWTETAWGAGFDFPGRNWATYFTYTVQEEATGSLGDFVWEDQNQNGIQDAGEPGIPGVEVQLFDSPGGNLLATTVTDTNGNYQFSGLSPGDYFVQFVAPAGSVFTQQNVGGDDTLDSDADSSGLTDTVTLSAGENNPTIDAGLVQQPAAPIAVDDEVTTPVDTPVTIDVLANDFYDGQVIVSIQVFPQYGILGILDVGIFEYTPNPGFIGTDSFTYQICDNIGLCDTATVTIAVGP